MTHKNLPNPFPPAIRRIGIFALSRAPNPERLQEGVSLLHSWGLETVLPRFASSPVRYLAAPDEERLASFRQLLEDPGLDFLMAANGGFGVTRILDDFPWEMLRVRKIPICGFSDVSALLLAAYAHGCRQPLIHGPMVGSTFGKLASSPDPEKTLDSFQKCLQGDSSPFLPGCRIQILKHGMATAPIIPCNFTLLRALIGTPHMPELSNAILAIEEITEPAHEIDRGLAQLQSAGILSRLKGLLFGQFTEMEDSEYLPEIFREWAEKISGPVLAGLPFGHELPACSLRVGQPLTIDTRALLPYTTLPCPTGKPGGVP